MKDKTRQKKILLNVAKALQDNMASICTTIYWKSHYDDDFYTLSNNLLTLMSPDKEVSVFGHFYPDFSKESQEQRILLTLFLREML